jgi:very-short-patch-repair endonuclease
MIDHHAPGAIGRARRLRREATLPEKRLWAELRKLDPQFRRQAPIGRYIVDFACHRAALVVEIDGARHDLPEAQLHDYERTVWLNSQGYRVLRFRNEDVLADAVGVAESIRLTIKALPLDGGGLGGGVRTGGENDAGLTSPAFLSAPTVRTPPSPTLPPSRGKGD